MICLLLCILFESCVWWYTRGMHLIAVPIYLKCHNEEMIYVLSLLCCIWNEWLYVFIWIVIHYFCVFSFFTGCYTVVFLFFLLFGLLPFSCPNNIHLLVLWFVCRIEFPWRIYGLMIVTFFHQQKSRYFVWHLTLMKDFTLLFWNKTGVCVCVCM